MGLPETASGVLSSGEIRDEGVDLTFLMWLTARGTTALMDATVAAAGLTGDEFAVYSILAASETTTPSTLSRWMAAPPTTVSSYVKRFETRGHVRRVPNPDDRRSYRIVLTEAGQGCPSLSAQRLPTGPRRTRPCAGRNHRRLPQHRTADLPTHRRQHPPT